MMSIPQADWDAYAHSTNSIIIRAYYFFTVWRNYRWLLQGLKIPQGRMLEIGASTGQNSLRLAKFYNLQPTLVDTSPLALAMAKQRFKHAQIGANFILEDVLDLSLSNQFEIVHSHGLLEHFKPSIQKIAFHNHSKHVKPDGWLISWVPTPDIPYRINRWYLEHSGQWIFGFEEPIKLGSFIKLFERENLIIRKIRHAPGWIGIAAQKMLI
ncbi:MAG: class I SAM-dependent methyltransferase [Candidatus Heimdallarchaeota archaeon]